MNEHLYLMHHGIKGQKWGVRRFQNPDGSLTAEGVKRYREVTNYGIKGGTIPKGTTLYRVTSTPNEKGGRRTYVSTNKFDNAMWEDYFGRHKNFIFPAKNYTVSYKTMKDIKVADETAIGKAWLEEYKSSKNDTWRDTEVSVAFLDYNTAVGKGFAKEVLYGGSNIVLESPTGDRIMKRLHDKGYGAVSDIFGRDTANDPLIVLDPDARLRKASVSDVYKPTGKEIRERQKILTNNNELYNKNYYRYRTNDNEQLEKFRNGLAESGVTLRDYERLRDRTSRKN